MFTSMDQWIGVKIPGQFPEISYIFSIYVLYIDVLYFMGKKPMDSGELSFPPIHQPSVTNRKRSWSTSKKS